jgi:NAD(P)H-hydrate repair Nnr-like enzyme with NAD(P)H-hydrate dehydratase domain
VIVRNDLMGHAHPYTPSAFDFKIQAEADSMFNTPTTYSIYVAGLVFQWLKRQGGLAAIDDDPRLVAGLVRGAVLIPNSGEQNLIPGHDARSAADVTGAVVAVRGVETEVSGPGGPVFVDRSGNSGLASSGSGDVFAGALAGLCARGAEPLTATLWATAIHGRAGERCAERIGPVGYVARDLLAELPALVASCEK